MYIRQINTEFLCRKCVSQELRKTAVKSCWIHMLTHNFNNSNCEELKPKIALYWIMLQLKAVHWAKGQIKKADLEKKSCHSSICEEEFKKC